MRRGREDRFPALKNCAKAAPPWPWRTGPCPPRHGRRYAGLPAPPSNDANCSSVSASDRPIGSAPPVEQIQRQARRTKVSPMVHADFQMRLP